MSRLSVSTNHRGRVQVCGLRCEFHAPEQSLPVLIKCPGLGMRLVRDTSGIPVRNGRPMVDVSCEIVGRLVETDVSPYHFAIVDVEAVTIGPESENPIKVDLEALGELSHSQSKDIEYFKTLYTDSEVEKLRAKLLLERQAW